MMVYKSPVTLTSDMIPERSLNDVNVPQFRGGYTGVDVWRTAKPTHTHMARPIIIDCDPGLDDAVALMLACAHPNELDLKLVTTVCGNSNVAQLTNNALRLLHLLGCDHIPVAQGHAKPSAGDLVTAECVHGVDGLGGIKIPNSPVPPIADDAVMAIAKTVEKCYDGMTLVCMGPLTNIAQFIQQYPHLKPKITQIVSMGGAVFGGNMTPATEFNYYTDPESVDVVFNSDIPMVMLGLDVTIRAKFLQRHIDGLVDTVTKQNNPVVRVYHYLMQYCYDREMPHFLYEHAEHGMNMHDVTCIAYLLRPDIFTLKKCHGAIELNGTHTRGKTVIDFVDLTDNPPNIDVGFRVDAGVMRQMVIDALYSYS